MIKNKESQRVSPAFFKQPTFNYSEGFDAFRTNFLSLAKKQKLNSVLLTSSIYGEGKTEIAINLSISLAEIGHKVLVIDTDFRKPKLDKLLSINLSKKTSLEAVIHGEENLEDAIINCETFNFDVLGSMKNEEFASSLVASNQMEKIIKTSENTYDFVIVIASPASEFSDSASLSHITEGSILVVRQCYSNHKQVARAHNSMRKVNSAFTASVLNGYNEKKDFTV